MQTNHFPVVGMTRALAVLVEKHRNSSRKWERIACEFSAMSRQKWTAAQLKRKWNYSKGYSRATWTPQEDQNLILNFNSHPLVDWEKIGLSLGKSPQQCQKRKRALAKRDASLLAPQTVEPVASAEPLDTRNRVDSPSSPMDNRVELPCSENTGSDIDGDDFDELPPKFMDIPSQFSPGEDLQGNVLFREDRIEPLPDLGNDLFSLYGPDVDAYSL